MDNLKNLKRVYYKDFEQNAFNPYWSGWKTLVEIEKKLKPPFRTIQRPFIWKRWEIQTAIFRIWMPSVNWLINMDYHW